MGSYDHQSSWTLIKALCMVLNAYFGKMFFNLQKSYNALLVFIRTPYLKRKYLICLSVSNYFLSLLTRVWFKTHVPLENSVPNYSRFIQSIYPVPEVTCCHELE